MPYKDPNDPRKREVRKNNYEKNKQAIIARVSRNKKANRAWFSTFKRTLKCTDCGQDHPATLDFHHVIHDKNHRKVNDLVSDGHSKARIIAEIAKCVVLCSNCHRIHHHNERIVKKKLAKAKKSTNIHTVNTKKGVKNMATKGKMTALFAGKESKKEEKAEKKVTGKAYKAAEKVEEAKMKKAKK